MSGRCFNYYNVGVVGVDGDGDDDSINDNDADTDKIAMRNDHNHHLTAACCIQKCQSIFKMLKISF